MLSLPELQHRTDGPATRVGLDLARISAVAESIQRFGRRYTDRVFTSGELDYALGANGLVAQRLAARFAAKEAVIKALGLAETGLQWRDIEVVREDDGACRVCLHGNAARAARAARLQDLQLSLSHDGDYAGAVVLASFAEPDKEVA